MINQLFTTESGDKAAIGLSLACALHCLMVPLLLALFPSGALSGLGDERIHLGLLFLIIPISVFSLTLGCRVHRNLMVVAVGVTGICILCLSALWRPFGLDFKTVSMKVTKYNISEFQDF